MKRKNDLRTNFIFPISFDDRRKLKIICAVKEISMADCLNRLIKEYIEINKDITS